MFRLGVFGTSHSDILGNYPLAVNIGISGMETVMKNANGDYILISLALNIKRIIQIYSVHFYRKQELLYNFVRMFQ